jgi:hypothetical protein
VVLAGERVKRKEHRPPRADDKDAAVAAPEQSPGPERVKLIDVEPHGRVEDGGEYQLFAVHIEDAEDGGLQVVGDEPAVKDWAVARRSRRLDTTEARESEEGNGESPRRISARSPPPPAALVAHLEWKFVSFFLSVLFGGS